jgi:hypothetical protein
MGDPCTTVKLSEVVSDCYAKHYYNFSYSIQFGAQGLIHFKIWPCSALQTLRSEFFTVVQGLSIGRNIHIIII